MHVWVCVCVCARARMHIFVHVCMCVCACIDVYVFIFKHVWTDLCVYIHINCLQPGDGDVTYSVVPGSNGANFFGVLSSGVIVLNRDLTTDGQNANNYVVSFDGCMCSQFSVHASFVLFCFLFSLTYTCAFSYIQNFFFWEIYHGSVYSWPVYCKRLYTVFMNWNILKSDEDI